jgi:hypothetical protein
VRDAWSGQSQRRDQSASMGHFPSVLEPLLNYGQLATELRLSIREVRTLVQKGIVPHLRLGHRTVKFQRSQVERALKRREVKAAGDR